MWSVSYGNFPCFQRYQGQGFVFEGEDERGALYVSVKQVEMVGLDKVAQQQRLET